MCSAWSVLCLTMNRMCYFEHFFRVSVYFYSCDAHLVSVGEEKKI